MNQERSKRSLGRAAILLGAACLLLLGVRAAFSATGLPDEGALESSLSLPVFADAFPAGHAAAINKLGAVSFQGAEDENLDADDIDGSLSDVVEVDTASEHSGDVAASRARVSAPIEHVRERLGLDARRSVAERLSAARSDANRSRSVRGAAQEASERKPGLRERARLRTDGVPAYALSGWPAAGRISSLFGFRRHPITGRIRFHCGLDIAAPIGSPVHAFREGVVIFSGQKGGYGMCVDISHPDGLVTRYAHNSKLLVRVGSRVRRGAVIAKVGSSGYSTGPHVHFEAIRRGLRINPLKILACR